MSVYFQNKENVVAGIISDTHGLLVPAAVKTLHGVDLIIHAGDIGSTEVMDELRAIAPVVRRVWLSMTTGLRSGTMEPFLWI